ncbi:MAG: SpoIIE family protein phosphatase [Gammaproteobacteria bacterium]
MTSVKIFQDLRQSTLLESAPESVVNKLAEIVVTTSIKAGETLFEKGDRGDAMYIISNGQVRAHDGDLELSLLGKGQVFGEMATLAADEVRSASITADEDTTLLRLDREALFGLLSSEPEVAKTLIHVLCQREKNFIQGVTRRSLEVRAFECELEIGRKIQAGFLPESLPQVPGWEIAAHFQAAQEVAGDFYDAFSVSAQGNIALVIGDVCGKGIGAALFMTLFRSLIRATLICGDVMSWAKTDEDNLDRSFNIASPECRQTLRDAVSLTNNYISRTHAKDSMFASLFLGLLDPDTGSLRYVNGGHEAPVIFNRKGIKKRLEPTGPVVGIIPGASYGVEQAQLDPGDCLIAYSDGVTDAVNCNSDQFGEDRLLSLLGQEERSAQALLTDVISRLHEFADGAAQFDDITLLSVRSTLQERKRK